MPVKKVKKVVISTEEKISDLIRNNNLQDLKDFLNDQYPQDLAPVLKEVKPEEKKICFSLLEPDNAGKVLAELNFDSQVNLLIILGPDKFASIISQMDVDDVTDFIIQLPEKEKSALLKELPDPVQQAHVQELIHYPPESAGGIMSTDFLRLRSDMTIHLAMNYVRRQAADYKSEVYYLYVADNSNKLVGVITLKNLICAPLSDIVANHMSTDVITCKVTDDQEQVAQAISKYDLIAIPIIDEENSLKGIVTVDDVVDILNRETTEDIYQGSGISDEVISDELISGKVSHAVKARLPWLLITLAGEAVASLIIASHNKTIITAPIAVSFMPLLSGLSGNVGGQTATIIVRGLVTGDINLKNTVRHIFHELKIGFSIGLVCSIITGLIAWYEHSMPVLGLVVAFSLCCSIISAVLLGSIFPILLQYFKKDPAAASSPMITTMLDILTFTFYLFIVSATINYIK